MSTRRDAINNEKLSALLRLYLQAHDVAELAIHAREETAKKLPVGQYVIDGKLVEVNPFPPLGDHDRVSVYAAPEIL